MAKLFISHSKELRHTLAVQKQRGKDAYPVVPLSLDGTKLGDRCRQP